MTSQIVLMNGFGVALASDSTVTLGDSRTYDTAEKVVALPLPHRIAVMHSGRVRIGNLPYSVLVGEWVRQLGTKALRSSAAYAKSFQDWLANNPQWFSTEEDKLEIINFIERRAEALAGRFKAESEAQEDFLFHDLLTRWTNEVQALDRLEGASVTTAMDIFNEFKSEIDSIFESNIAPISGEEETKTAFIRYCAEFFSSEWMTNSTLTFSGYGENEIYPSYTCINFHGFVNGKLTWKQGESYSLSPTTNPLFGICLPAQHDAINQYLLGYDENMIEELIENAFNERINVLNEVRNRFGEATKSDAESELIKKFDEAVISVLQDFETATWKVTDEFSERHYVSHLRRAIAALPVGSLVDVARSLIELQALRKTTTAQTATVGGPIDVALISPIDGFQWIRHKTIL